MTFSDWLTAELEKRGWTPAELAQRAGMSHARVRGVMDRTSHPGFEFCVSVARAFGYPTAVVYRQAGLLPPISEDDVTRQINEWATILTPDDREYLLRMAKALALLENEERR